MITIVFFFGIFAVINAQNPIVELDEFVHYNHINLTNSRSNNSYENIKGSPFLFDDFVVGQVKMKNGKIYKGELRFDEYADQLEFKNQKGEVLTVLSSNNIERVVLRNVTLVNVPESPNSDKDKFYREITSGKYSLLAQEPVVYKDPQSARPYVEARPAMFVKRDLEYYVWNPKTGLVQLKNKKSFDEIATSQNAKLHNFIKKEKIKVSDEEGLIKLVQYLNQL